MRLGLEHAVAEFEQPKHIRTGNLITDYTEYEIKDTYGISLAEFLGLPIVEYDFLIAESVRRAKELKRIKDAMKDGNELDGLG